MKIQTAESVSSKEKKSNYLEFCVADSFPFSSESNSKQGE